MGRTSVRCSAVFLALSVALTAAGCGKKDDAVPLPPVPQGTTPPLTKDEYVLQANKICAAADKLITGLTNDNGPINNSSGQGSTDALKELVAKIRPIGQNAIDQLKALTPPAADAPMITRGITMMQTKLDQSQTTPSDTLDPIGQPDQELYTYGLYSCFTKPGG